MNIYDAIMKAADQVEKHPRTFDFDRVTTPRSCGTPGCALGWIGFFMGVKAKTSVGDIPHMYMGAPPGHRGAWFYERMNRLVMGWSSSAVGCAKGLRLYAAKYHTPAKPHFTGLPDIVRDIFRERVS